MIDLIALWIGRVVLILVVLAILLITGYVIKIACRRPYYCIKYILPWNWIDEKGWQDWLYWYKKMENLRAFEMKFSRYGHLGIMRTVKGKKWFEPNHYFLWIRG